MSDIVTLNGYKIKDEKAVRSYETVSLMKADTKLKEGYHVKTKGYYEANDGGSATYKITDTASETEFQEELDNGLYATLIVENYVTPIMVGVQENNDIKDFLSKSNNNVDLNGKNYTLSDEVISNFKELCNGTIEFLSDASIKFVNKKNILLNNLKIQSQYQYEHYNDNQFELITITRCSNIIIKNCHVDYNDKGIVINDSELINIYNNIFEHSKSGAIELQHIKEDEIVYTLDNIGCRNIEIHNNIFRNGYEGIKLAYYIQNCEIHGNNCYENTRDGIDYAGHYINGLFIHDNNIHDNTNNGIEIKELVISDGYNPTIETRKMINVKIHSNIINHATQSSGINIQNHEASVETDVEIYNNKINFFNDGGRGIRTNIEDNGIVNIYNNIINGNNYYSIGIGIINSSNVKVFNNNIKNVANHGIYCEQQETSDNNHFNISIKENEIISGVSAIKLDSTFENCVVTENILDSPSSKYLIVDDGTNNYTLLNTVPYKIVSMSGNTPVLENSETPRMEIGTILYNKDLTTTNSVGLIATSRSTLSAATYSKYIEISNL